MTPPATFGQVLLALTAVLVACRAAGWVATRLGQPAVIGEIVAGLLLGPSLFGRVAPAVAASVFPPAVLPHLAVVAELGVVLYMFLVGVELNAGAVGRRVWQVTLVANGGIVVPFALGAGLAGGLYPRYAGPGASVPAFTLFMGVSLSVTAFPVLARILADRRLTRTELGGLALGAAAVGDVAAWCLLALFTGVMRTRPEESAVVVAWTAAFVGLMFGVVRWLVVRYLARPGQPARPGNVAVALLGLLAASLTTDAIGVHTLFGAFLFGTVIPHDSRLAAALREKLADATTLLLLPAFFAVTGLRTELGLLNSAEAWTVCGLVIAAAMAGKLGGTLVAARLSGFGWHDATTLGVLMNTRGLMELIVLNVGREAGVISDPLFVALVVMALVTTATTAPMLRLLGQPGQPRPTADRPSLGSMDARGVPAGV